MPHTRVPSISLNVMLAHAAAHPFCRIVVLIVTFGQTSVCYYPDHTRFPIAIAIADP